MKTLIDAVLQRLVRRRSIRSQVLAISLVGVLAFMIVATIMWAAQARRSRMQSQMDASWFANLHVVRAGMTFEAARNLGNVFLAERRSEVLSREQATFARAAGLLEQALSEEAMPQISERMTDVLRLMGVYQHDFLQATATIQTVGLQPTEGLQGRMRGSVDGVEDILEVVTGTQASDETPLLRLKVSLLQMRRAEMEFMLRGDPVYAAAMGAHAAEFVEALEASLLPQDKRDQLAAAIGAYQRDFRELSDVLTELPNQLEQLRGMADRLSASLEDLAGHIDISRAAQADATAAAERTGPADAVSRNGGCRAADGDLGRADRTHHRASGPKTRWGDGAAGQRQARRRGAQQLGAGRGWRHGQGTGCFQGGAYSQRRPRSGAGDGPCPPPAAPGRDGSLHAGFWHFRFQCTGTPRGDL